MMTGVRRGLYADAFGQAFFAQIRAPGPGGNCHMNRVAARGHAHLLGTDPDQRAQVAGFQLVRAHDFLLCFDHGLHVERDLHLEDLGRVVQPLRVFLQPEDRRAIDGVVSADTLEHCHAVMQAVREHVQSGIAPVDQLAVFPDFSVAVSHGHVRFSSEYFKPAILADSAPVPIARKWRWQRLE